MAETTRSSKPIFSRAANSKSVKDYLAQLDEITRRNKGGFSAVAEETGSSIPFMLPGRAVKSGVPEMPQRQVAELPAPEEYQVQPQEPMVGEVQGAETQSSGQAQQFIEAINSMYGGDQLYQTGVGSSGDGGTILSGGETIYPSGNIRTPDGQDVYAMGSAPGGGLYYSDGKIRYIDPNTAGLEGLMEILGLSGQAITQDYGNVNQDMGYTGGVHGGTDIRTRDLQNKAFSLPFEAQVLEVISADSGSPYGNSVLIALPTGESIRLSHLADMGQFQAGSTIAPGGYIGTFGSTGNSTAEHLDLEYYNKDGQRSDPSTFQGLVSPEYLAPYVQPKTEAPIQSSPEMTAQTQPQPTITSGMTKLQEAAKALGYSPDTSTYTPKQTSDVALTSMGFDPQGTIGFQEALAGDFPAAGRELSQTIERVNPTPRIDLGVSELLRGDVEGAKQQFGSTMQRAGSRIAQLPQQLKEAIVNPAYAGDGQEPKQTLGDNLKYMGDKVGEYVGAKAGEGIDKLKSVFSKGGSGVNLFSRPAMSSMGQQRAVGEQGSSSSLLPTSFADARSAKAAQTPNDIRDPFFKTGMNEKYGIKDTAGGALSLDMFGPEFFQNPDNIQSVFKGTQFEAPATAKYQAYVEEQRRIEEERRRQQESQNNQNSNQGSPAYNPGGTQGGYVSNSQPTQQQKSNYTYGVQPGIGGKQITTQINNTPVAYDFGTRSSGSAQAQPQPQQNIFQKAASTVSNLFKKWFQ